MKIALSIDGVGETAALDPRFGRAPHFWIVEPETNVASYLNNEAAAAAAHGAGLRAVQMLARAGVRAVVTGQVGTKALAALRAAGIKAYHAPEGLAAEALRAFVSGGLAELSEYDGSPHG